MGCSRGSKSSAEARLCLRMLRLMDSMLRYCFLALRRACCCWCFDTIRPFLKCGVLDSYFVATQEIWCCLCFSTRYAVTYPKRSRGIPPQSCRCDSRLLMSAWWVCDPEHSSSWRAADHLVPPGDHPCAFWRQAERPPHPSAQLSESLRKASRLDVVAA